MFGKALTFIQTYSDFIQLLLLLVLGLVTVFRKRLSSNDSYRTISTAKPSSASQPAFGSDTTSKTESAAGAPEPMKGGFVATASAFGHSTGGAVYKRGQSRLERLNADLLLYVVQYLHNDDIITLQYVSKELLIGCRSDALWEQLWRMTYGRMWNHFSNIRMEKNIRWDPMLNFGPPQQGWFQFFMLFDAAWMDWLLAGYCTTERCYIGINNCVLDVTAFSLGHPGSTEVLTEASGCDGTEAFKEIGHTFNAQDMVPKLAVWRADICMATRSISISTSVRSLCGERSMSKNSPHCRNDEDISAVLSASSIRSGSGSSSGSDGDSKRRRGRGGASVRRMMAQQKEYIAALHYQSTSSGATGDLMTALADTMSLPNMPSLPTFSSPFPSLGIHMPSMHMHHAFMLNISDRFVSSINIDVAGISHIATEKYRAMSGAVSGISHMATEKYEAVSGVVSGAVQDAVVGMRSAAVTAGEKMIETVGRRSIGGAEGGGGGGEEKESKEASRQQPKRSEIAFTPMSKLLPSLGGYHKDCIAEKRRLEEQFRASRRERRVGGGSGGGGPSIQTPGGDGVTAVLAETSDDEHEVINVFFEHCGTQKVFFDPLSSEWVIWWTCCGCSQRLVNL